MEDLIQNAYTLFNERPFPSQPVPSPDAAEPTSTFTYGSLFLTPELPQAEVQAMGSATRHRPEYLGGAPTSAQPSFSSLPSDTAVESHLTPSPTPLLSPLLGFPSSQQTLTETTMQEPVTPEVRGTKAVEGLANSPPAEAHPRACHALPRMSPSPLLPACKLEWGGSPHDTYFWTPRFHRHICILEKPVTLLRLA
ncbi:hypothetical protein EDB83DRAFT_696231 [Lactarius deliciosus]|nr:hypothetical protein EDB83DRAFT_696231 [Lactarius deliciosus]